MAFRPGDAWPPNAWFNDLLRAARRSRILGIGAGLELVGGSLGLAPADRIWARVTGTGNPYAFAEAIAAPAGFAILPGGRTDAGGKQPAIEANGATGLSGTYQLLRRSACGDWRFRDQRAGGGGGGYTPPPAPKCFASSGTCPSPGYYLAFKSTKYPDVPLACGRQQQYIRGQDHNPGDEWSGTTAGTFHVYGYDGDGNISSDQVYRGIEVSIYYTGGSPGTWTASISYFDPAPGQGLFNPVPVATLVGGSPVCSPFSVTWGPVTSPHEPPQTYVAVVPS